MIDTIKSSVQANLFEFLFRSGSGKSSELHSFIARKGADDVSLVTIKRLLGRLQKEGSLAVAGKGPATRYALTPLGRLTAKVDAHAYCAEEPDRRFGLAGYQFDLFPALAFDPFSPKELEALETATAGYRGKSNGLSEALRRKELERFVIELSWKSSKIEGNTYTLLDTERLLKDGSEAAGHGKDEATMILNHKAAFSYITEHRERFSALTRAGAEEVHDLLTRGLSVARGFRSGLVGVTGSRYRPLDNRYQIEEAFEELAHAVGRMPHGYAKALVALVGLSYIQPFEDGNKRSARLMGNALLLSHGLSPLSYRSVSEEAYREAMLAFYELNTLEPFKALFLEQYRFSAETYALS
ncbi:MAG: Fic family protein [bacterium]